MSRPELPQPSSTRWVASCSGLRVFSWVILTSIQSGAGEFLDEDVGMSCGETVYSDLNIPLIEALPDTAMHREVDLAMVAADKEGM